MCLLTNLRWFSTLRTVSICFWSLLIAVLFRWGKIKQIGRFLRDRCWACRWKKERGETGAQWRSAWGGQRVVRRKRENSKKSPLLRPADRPDDTVAGRAGVSGALVPRTPRSDGRPYWRPVGGALVARRELGRVGGTARWAGPTSVRAPFSPACVLASPSSPSPKTRLSRDVLRPSLDRPDVGPNLSPVRTSDDVPGCYRARARVPARSWSRVLSPPVNKSPGIARDQVSGHLSRSPFPPPNLDTGPPEAWPSRRQSPSGRRSRTLVTSSFRSSAAPTHRRSRSTRRQSRPPRNVSKNAKRFTQRGLLVFPALSANVVVKNRRDRNVSPPTLPTVFGVGFPAPPICTFIPIVFSAPDLFCTAYIFLNENVRTFLEKKKIVFLRTRRVDTGGTFIIWHPTRFR